MAGPNRIMGVCYGDVSAEEANYDFFAHASGDIPEGACALVEVYNIGDSQIGAKLNRTAQTPFPIPAAADGLLPLKSADLGIDRIEKVYIDTRTTGAPFDGFGASSVMVVWAQ